MFAPQWPAETPPRWSTPGPLGRKRTGTRSVPWCGTSAMRALSSATCPPSGACPAGTGRSLGSPAQTVSTAPPDPHGAQHWVVPSCPPPHLGHSSGQQPSPGTLSTSCPCHPWGPPQTTAPAAREGLSLRMKEQADGGPLCSSTPARSPVAPVVSKKNQKQEAHKGTGCLPS